MAENFEEINLPHLIGRLQVIASDNYGGEHSYNEFAKEIMEYIKLVRQDERTNITKEHTRDNAKVYQQGVKDTQERIEKGLRKYFGSELGEIEVLLKIVNPDKAVKCKICGAEKEEESDTCEICGDRIDWLKR